MRVQPEGAKNCPIKAKGDQNLASARTVVVDDSEAFLDAISAVLENYRNVPGFGVGVHKRQANVRVPSIPFDQRLTSDAANETLRRYCS